jgi:hypothetical protein
MSRTPKIRNTSSGPAKSLLEQSFHAVNVPDAVPPTAVLATAVEFPCGHKHVGIIVTVDSSLLGEMGDPALRTVVAAAALSALPDAIKEAWGLGVLQGAISSMDNGDGGEQSNWDDVLAALRRLGLNVQ